MNIPEDDEPLEAVARLIERDLMDYEDRVLPISGNDVMDLLGIPPGAEVGAFLRYARELFGAGVRERSQLLELIRQHAMELHGDALAGGPKTPSDQEA